MIFMKRQIRNIAKAIASDLFTNGVGQHAGRLVLVSLKLDDAPERNLGGWSEGAVVDRVSAILEKRLRVKR